MHQEKYSLTWHTYSDHLKSMMKELMMNEDFSDVTLVTEDKKQIKAHINILSACSPVFKDILKKERNSSAIMYLRGIQYSEMESIMQFIYLGEATFYKERMDEFLSVAKSLEIKTLCNPESESNDEPEDETSLFDSETSTENVQEHPLISDNLEENPVISENQEEHQVISDNLEEHQVLCDTETSTDKLGEHTVISDEKIKLVKVTQQAREDVTVDSKYECDLCLKTFSNSSNFNSHKKSVHEGIRYACNQCDYQATHNSHLTLHIQSKHEGVKYACDQCDYETADKSNLTKHIQSKHEGIKYACDQCDYQTKRQDNLTVHIQSKHEGIKYACNQCDYQGNYQANLIAHIKRKHEGINVSV